MKSASRKGENAMRIAFDYQVFVMQSYGGVSRYFARLADGLLQMGNEVEIFAPLHRNKYLQALPKGVINGLRINNYPPKTLRLFTAYNRLRSEFQIAKWQPNIVHETYYSRVRSAPSTCPTIITVHDMIHDLFRKEFPKYEEIAAVRRLAIDRADHVICVSENTRLDLMRLYGTPSSKLSVVHHGVDQFVPRNDPQRTVVPTGRPFLLYVGHRGGYKNFVGFLKAVASSNRLLSDFDIVAFGGQKFSTSELNLMSSLGFRDEQVQHKSGNDDLMGSFYRSASAFVYPSFYEGFGFPPLEAMAHKCPVITSNTSSMPEVIGGAGEYFNPGDLGDMRRAIEAVVYSSARVEYLRSAGVERLNAFSWKKCAQETLNVYRTLA